MCSELYLVVSHNLQNCILSLTQLRVISVLNFEHVFFRIDPNDVDNVACLGARYNTSVVDVLLAGYTNAASLVDRRLLVLALGCVVDANSVQK